MNNDAFITTSKPTKAIELIHKYGYDFRIAGRLQKAQGERTGIKLKAYDGEEVYFSGKN